MGGWPVIAATAIAFATAFPAAAQVTVDLPLGVGLQIPSYDRVDGLSLPFGPKVTFGEDRFVVEPTITYRSHLGKIDPSLALTAQLGADSAFSVGVMGARGTFTNDGWIRSDLMNSLFSFGLGRDARNYFRADRAEARFTARLPIPMDVARLFVGARTENDWSTGWRADEQRGPFSIFGRHDQTDGIDRPNPEINRGHVTSAIGGGRIQYKTERRELTLDALVEVSGDTPLGSNFHQLTLDEQGGIATFGDQRFEADGHLVTTGSGPTPAQRYAYVGGSGTLATLDLLQLGGDQMYFIDTRYIIPIHGIDIPFLGSPFIAPRFAAGAGSVGGFGRVVQNVGLRLGAGLVRVDVVINPRTHQRDQGVGISFSR